LAARALIVLIIVVSIAEAVGTTTAVHFYDGIFHSSFGSSVASVGDVTDDGVPDFALGAEFSSAGASLGGEVIVFDGASGSERFRIAGSVAQRYFGTGIWPAGDFNGDGRDELIASDLSTRTLDELGGRRLELRDSLDRVVLETVLPYLAHEPNEKLSDAFAAADGSPFPDATGRIVGTFKGSSGKSKVEIAVKGTPSSELVHLWVETFSGS
jgi:hypothetical protein